MKHLLIATEPVPDRSHWNAIFDSAEAFGQTWSRP
jgi:hypothetical protein